MGLVEDLVRTSSGAGARRKASERASGGAEAWMRIKQGEEPAQHVPTSTYPASNFQFLSCKYSQYC